MGFLTTSSTVEQCFDEWVPALFVACTHLRTHMCAGGGEGSPHPFVFKLFCCLTVGGGDAANKQGNAPTKVLKKKRANAQNKSASAKVS